MRMLPGAPTPEELEMLLEDAQLIHDHDAVAALFEPGAIVVVGEEPPVRGGDCVRLAMTLGGRSDSYLAEPRTVVVTRDLGLIVTRRGANVVRRDAIGAWRYAILWLQASAVMERTRP